MVLWLRQASPQDDRDLASATPSVGSPRLLSLRSLIDRRSPLPLSGAPLTVPPPVLPQPLPPQQAWPSPPPVAQPAFVDLDASHWAWPILADLAQRQLISGFPDGSFRPAGTMTRAEFAAQIDRFFSASKLSAPNNPAAVGNRAYPDLAPDHWAYKSVQRAVALGFLSPDAQGAFQPDQTLHRIHVIVALANGLALKTTRSDRQSLMPYGDRDQVPAWATQPLVAALEADLVVNQADPLKLAPHRAATRAEVAVMLHRGLVYTGMLAPVPLPPDRQPATQANP
jgi:hypothetical protein